MTNQSVIEVSNLSFSYSKTSKKILDNISMKVPKGAIYGFLGANGAGKSTTMQLLTGSITADTKNAISLFDISLEKQLPLVFKRIGTLIESPALYSHLSGYDNLRYMSTMKGILKADINRVLDLVGLTESAGQKVKQYSSGMKQRLAIGFALLGSPELLLLDEPINALDPQGVIDMRTLLVKLNKEEGITIFVSSHLLDEVEKICTHIGVLNKGKLVFDDTIDALKVKSKKAQNVTVTLKHVGTWFKPLKETYPNLIQDENTISLEAKKKEAIDNFLIDLVKSGADISLIKTDENLEDLFLNLSQ